MHSETRLYIAPDHPAFAGHFPGAPIVPGVVLLDAAVHAMLQLLRPPGTAMADGSPGEQGCQIGVAKFFSPVGPGETLTISLTTGGAGNTRFDIASGSRMVATGSLMLPTLP